MSLAEAGEILAREITPFFFLMQSILIHFFFLKDHDLSVSWKAHMWIRIPKYRSCKQQCWQNTDLWEKTRNVVLTCVTMPCLSSVLGWHCSEPPCPVWQGLGAALRLVCSQCSGICSWRHFHPLGKAGCSEGGEGLSYKSLVQMHKEIGAPNGHG